MKSLKKLFSILLVIVMLMTLCSCGSGAETEIEVETFIEYPSGYSSTVHTNDASSQIGQSADESQGQSTVNPSSQSGNTTTTPKEENKKVNTIKVLAIGNSYSNNTTKYISQIADATAGDTTVFAASLYYPGATLSLHVAMIEQWNSIFAEHNLEETKQIYYSSEVPSTRKYDCLTVGDKTIKTIKSLYEAIRYEDWDYITIQQSPDGCDNFATYEPYLTKLYDYIQAEYKRDDMKGKTCPPILVHQTWAFNNDMAQNDAYQNYPVHYKNNTEMFKKVEEAYNKAVQQLKDTKNVTASLIKSGEAVELAQKEFGYSRTASENLADNTLYADDISHLNDRGCYLTACVWIETLAKLEEVTIDTRTTSFFPSVRGLSADDCKNLQYIARRVVLGEK